MGITIQHVVPERAFPLRREVLRPWMTLEELAASDSGEGTTLAAIAAADGAVVACATLLVEAPPEIVQSHVDAALVGYRLRNMATMPTRRGQGHGRAVLEACFAEVEEHGGGVLWCHAREGAIAFYEKMGLQAVGEHFEIDRIGLHVVMWKLIATRAVRDPAPS